ncbi:MAG: hypothetical protein KC636_23620 [Myxococcales bacterium]|nr:hypothetical protein [Myxococcales bacterium]
MADFVRANPPRDSIGCAPLTSLGLGTYKGEEGGLYPGGVNHPPIEHFTAGLGKAARIVPRAADGSPAEDGKIGLLSVGLSNTNSEFQVFQHLVSVSPAMHPALVTINGAQPRKSAEIMEAARSNYWPTIDQRVAAEGLTNEQVQAVWLKSSTKAPSRPFPEEPKRFYECLVNTMHILVERFANLQIVYLSSRAYGGYSEIPLSPEPHAYESGFAIKWLIRDQIRGDPNLNYDPEKGPVRSPWLAWGPYLWADGVVPREHDGLTYERADMIWDGVHPSPTGREKVAALLFEYFITDRTAASWFLRPGVVDVEMPPLDEASGAHEAAASSTTDMLISRG